MTSKVHSSLGRDKKNIQNSILSILAIVSCFTLLLKFFKLSFLASMVISFALLGVYKLVKIANDIIKLDLKF